MVRHVPAETFREAFGCRHAGRSVYVAGRRRRRGTESGDSASVALRDPTRRQQPHPDRPKEQSVNTIVRLRLRTASIAVLVGLAAAAITPLAAAAGAGVQ